MGEEAENTVYTLVLSPARSPGEGHLVRGPLGGSERHALSGGAEMISPWTTITPPSGSPAMPETGPICGSRRRWLWPSRKPGAGGILSLEAFQVEGPLRAR